VLDLDRVLDNLGEMLMRTIGEDVRLKFDQDGALPPIWGDPIQMEQVVMNLVINARDAVPDGGRIVVSTRACVPDRETLSELPILTEGEHVELSVSDTGCGISEDDLPRIFEPFFTTRAKEHGTGLGLSTVHGIVTEHRGGIRVRTEPGVGTKFHVLLPVTDKEYDQENADGESVEQKRPCGSETILVVEDEPVVREVTAKLLRRLGYDVMQAGGGLEAIEVCREHGERIALLLTDVIMPDMNGMELSQKILALYPNMKVVFTSGYPESIIESRGIFDGDIDFLGKPYSPDLLAAKLREVLDR